MAKKKAPCVTFVGGKWYNEHGKEVPKPAPKTPPQPQGQLPLQRYDDDTILERIANCTCTKPQATGHVPGCVHFVDALYVCEQGNRESVAMLAKLADTTIADLERRRIDYRTPLADCPERIPQTDGRRRCMMCPYWTRHSTETPFDHQKGVAT